MVRYMLDSNMIAYAKNRRPASVLERLHQHDPSEICISAITMAELEISVFDATLEYEDIRHNLKSQGTLIGANNMLIATHAKVLDLILVTHNTHEFSRVVGLKLKDWTI